MEFWQMRLDEQSSKITCFKTPFDRYRFHRRVSCAPEKYHKAIHTLFEHIKGVDTSSEKVGFIWDGQEENCFKNLEEFSFKEPLLKLYDPDREIKISSDS